MLPTQTEMPLSPPAAAKTPRGEAPLGAPCSWRWGQLARSIGLDPAAPVLLALSGGADSVYLLHVLARARERALALAVHVDHGLRGEESAADREFCRRLCARVGVRFVACAVDLSGGGAPATGLEARARTARYAALEGEARRYRIPTVVTGHHADDALETLLLRWMRGTELGGLAGMARERALSARSGVRLARPLIAQRREEIREALKAWNETWREDSSNADKHLARNRLRHGLLVDAREALGDAGWRNLDSFARAVERLEASLAQHSAAVVWRPTVGELCARDDANAHLGGRVERAALANLPAPLLRRALWRLILEGVGRAPRRGLLDLLCAHVESGRRSRHALPGGWDLHLRGTELVLEPPRGELETPRGTELGAANARQLEFLFPGGQIARVSRARTLQLGEALELGSGRWLAASKLAVPSGSEPSSAPERAELDWSVVQRGLCVRHPVPGDRVRLLGAKGSRPLVRALADMGVPRAERSRTWLVCSGTEIVWVAGLRTAESARVDRRSTERLCLELLRARPEEPRGAPHGTTSAAAG